MPQSIDIIKRDYCNGCKACGDTCPKNAISYETDSEGFWYPSIDESKCISCGKCLSTCSSKAGENTEEYVKQAYASWNRDRVVRRESTSGGIYSAFADYVLDNGGIIVGSVYSEDYKSAYHICGSTGTDLEKIAGSKYFQSDTEGIYKKIQEALLTGKDVLFTGTPCQVSALKRFLGKEYEKLITIDFICRGVPSPLIHRKKIELYESEKKCHVVYYRDKWDKYAWIHFGELIKYENGKEQFISRWEDRINDCFVKYNLNVRPSCYFCEYKNGNNRSEVTIGDFWGISVVTEHDLTDGISALIVNSKKGELFIQKLKDRVYLERRPLDEVKRGNEAYVKAIEKPENREIFFEKVNSEGLKAAVNSCAVTTEEEKKILRRRLKRMKKRGLLPIYNNWKSIDWYQFIKYNYFCKQIKREKDAYLIPCKGSYVQLGSTGEIVLDANLFLNYYPWYKRAGRKSLLRIENNAKLVVHNDVEISYSNTLSVDRGGYVEMGHFYTGVGASLVCRRKMVIGNNVMLGRDVCIFDSDYHKIFDDKGKHINPDNEVVIEDNVWIGARSMVLKGTHLREGTIVSAGSMVMGETEANKVFINKREKKSVGDSVMWER